MLELGEVRCASADPELPVLGPIRGWCVSFPRLPVELRTRGRSRFLADGSTVLLLAPGTVLDRSALSGDGSRCQWVVFDESLVTDRLALGDPLQRRLLDRAGFLGLAKSPAMALTERRLFRRAANAPGDVDELADLACGIVDSALAAKSPDVVRSADLALTDAVRAILSLESARSATTRALAGRLGVSVYHLCRSFRRATGLTLQEYARRQRLDLALERLAERDIDLSALALDLGFSSHSHFSAAFRGSFGLTPSAYREQRRRRGRAIA
jgi:AraC-like DNA-binding protein